MSGVHPTAVVDPSAELADDVTIGAYSVIGAEVSIAAGTWIGPHVVIQGPAAIGRDNRIFQFASVGEQPQDKKYRGERTRLDIGDGNTIRDARLALGGVGTKPWRAQEAEQALKGQPATTATFEKAARIAMQGAKGYEHNAFKIPLGQQAIVRTLTNLTAG